MCLQNGVNIFNLTWITSLHYLVKHDMHIKYTLPLSYYGKKLQNLSHSHLNCGHRLRQIWIQLITACGRYRNRRCTKHASLIWSYQRRRHWQMSATMTTWPCLASSVLSRCFSSSDYDFFIVKWARCKCSDFKCVWKPWAGWRGQMPWQGLCRVNASVVYGTMWSALWSTVVGCMALKYYTADDWTAAGTGL